MIVGIAALNTTFARHVLFSFKCSLARRDSAVACIESIDCSAERARPSLQSNARRKERTMVNRRKKKCQENVNLKNHGNSRGKFSTIFSRSKLLLKHLEANKIAET